MFSDFDRRSEEPRLHIRPQPKMKKNHVCIDLPVRLCSFVFVRVCPSVFVRPRLFVRSFICPYIHAHPFDRLSDLYLYSLWQFPRQSSVAKPRKIRPHIRNMVRQRGAELGHVMPRSDRSFTSRTYSLWVSWTVSYVGLSDRLASFYLEKDGQTNA